MSRLPEGGLIDRRRPLRFSFDGRSYTGFAGDTLASALVANDVKLVARSFKYHRPRGLLTAGPEEPNALVTLRTGAHAEPNTPATTISLYDGLVATSQNRWPSLNVDLLSINQLASPIFVAGFYYKTFMWPAAFWEKVYEPLIRRAAGLGALSMQPDPDSYDRAHGFCDLLVIGAGPAGLAAALAAGRAGLRVFVTDVDARPGGRLLAERHGIGGLTGSTWAAQATDELSTLPNVTLLPRTGVFGVYDGCEYGAVERVSDHLAEAPAGQPRQRLWKIVAKHAVLATGALERPMVFGNNDRPGVMMASAVSAYLNRFAAAPGKRAVIFTSGDSGWRTALDLVAAGSEVAAIVDTRTLMPAIAEPLRAAGIPIFMGGALLKAHGRTVSSADIQSADGRVHRIACDLIAMAGGWNPAIGLGTNMGGRPGWSDAQECFLLGDTCPGLQPIGAAAGRFSLAEALADGARAGSALAEQLGRSPVTLAFPSIRGEASSDNRLWVPAEPPAKSFVDFQNDVTASDVALAAREGFTSIEHMKRYTTIGMATDQGKSGQMTAHALLAAATGKSIAEAGTIRSRPPYFPVAIGVLAGAHREAHFKPERRTASHDWAAVQGAPFVDAGQWKRAQWFPRQDDADWLVSVNREVSATRDRVGFCDVSTLGKIDVQGPDAATLLDRLYSNRIASLPVGRVRYGLMLREDGFVMDDGTITRLGEDHYLVSTTTANAARVMQHVDFARQVLWPTLDVQACSVTEQWASYSLAGPRSRDVLKALLPDIDLSNTAFPFMAAAQIGWRGLTVRLMRVSFSGELAYEISIGANHGMALLEALLEAGKAFDMTPYGTEALGVMRIEKGHPAGNELNGQTTAGDLGMAKLLSPNKDFIGKVMAQRPGLIDENRPQLVGIRPLDPALRLRAGGHLLSPNATAIATNVQGRATSVAFSPSLGHWIGLALVTRGPERWGEELVLHDDMRGARVPVVLCNPVFIDPEGVRLRG